MKHIEKFESFNESSDFKEKIPVQELIDDLIEADPEDFGDTVEEESPGYAMSEYISMGPGFYENGIKFKLIDTYEEKGDGYDEETRYGIFQRKSDSKFFKFWIHDDGSIGPGCLTMCDELEEVKPKKTKRIEYE